jgi:hypothetical protein
MRKITLRELANWPPEPGGAYESGTVFPVAGEAVVVEIFPVRDAMVTFRGEFGKYPHSYHYKASSEKIASQIHAVILANLGKTVAELGDLEIEIDEAMKAKS